MMHIRQVWMAVRQPFVTVGMRVRFTQGIIRCVLVLVMFVVHVWMGMLQ
jgi:hypothetical protein